MSEIKGLKKRQIKPAIDQPTDSYRVSYNNALFLYSNYSFIKRGVDKDSNAIVRNGFEVIGQSSRDQKIIDKFNRRNNIRERVKRAAKNSDLHGFQCGQLYDAKDGVRIAEMPVYETDFLRDQQDDIVYEDGAPKAYVQKRDSKNIATINPDYMVHFAFDRMNDADLGQSMLQSAVAPMIEYGFIRKNIGESYIRSLPVAHMQITDGTEEDVSEVVDCLQDQFSAESSYVTSDRFDINLLSSTAYNIQLANFTEPLIADVAAAFGIPVEILAPTSTLNDDKFDTRYAEWIEDVKRKQADFEYIMEEQIYNKLTSKNVEVRFRNPMAIKPQDLLKNIGFATQSEAITKEHAQQVVENNRIFDIKSN